MNRREVKKAPVLRFKGFTNDWEQRKLGDISEIIRGASPRPISDPKWFNSNSNIGWLRISDVTAQHGRIQHLSQHISILGQAKTRVISTPHLLLSIAASVGYPVINYVKTGVHDGFLIFENPKFNIDFGFYWLAFYKHEWQKFGQPGSQVNLNSSIVKKNNIGLPDNVEQKAIVHLLKLIVNCITLQQRKVKILVLLKKEISNYYFSPSYLSRSCKENSFKEIFTVVTDYVANGSFKSLRENVKTNTKQGYAYMIRLQDASNNWKGPWLYTDKSGYNFLKKSKIYPGDIVMSNVGSVGKIIRIPKLSKPMTLAPNAILLRSTKYDNDFLYELLKSDYGKNKIKRMTTPGVQNKINKTDFKKIKVHLPNSQEQKRISCLLTNMNILIHEVKSNISQKQKLKQFLLQNMFI